MVKKISVFIGILATGTLFSLHQEQPSETAQKLVALAESMNTLEQAKKGDKEIKRQNPHDWKSQLSLLDDKIAARTAIAQAVREFKSVEKIERKDLEEAQQKALGLAKCCVDWLQEPIEDYVMSRLARKHWACGRGTEDIPALRHLGALLRPYVSTQDMNTFKEKLAFRQEHWGRPSGGFTAVRVQRELWE